MSRHGDQQLESYQHRREHEKYSSVEAPSPFWGRWRRRNNGPTAAILLASTALIGIGWRGLWVGRPGRVGVYGSVGRRPGEDVDGVRDVPDLIWSDEFEGDSVDPTKWSFVNGDGCDVGLCGWGNNELEWYAPSNARVSGGKLVIEARRHADPGGPHRYTSAKIVSLGKADFGVVDVAGEGLGVADAPERSRRFESKLKLPWGRGIWPAFWMLPTHNRYGGWPKSGEIDIMENIGKEGPNTVHGTVHYGLDWPQHQYSESGITLSPPKKFSHSHARSSGNLNETFHTYAVERLSGEMRWYVDDVLYSSIAEEDLKPYRWTFDEEFYFILNLAVGGNWPGDPSDGKDGDATVFPQALEVDYVRVYEGNFPRVVGKGSVGCSEGDVIYEVVNVEAEAVSYTWAVPPNATVKEGQGTSSITVDFDFKLEENSIVDSEIIHIRANGIGDNSIQTSTGLRKLADHGIGIRVKVVDLDGECSSGVATGPEEFDFDCGRPATCTPLVLRTTAGEFTCGERIRWLVDEMGVEELDACRRVGYEEFHGQCGPCNPMV